MYVETLTHPEEHIQDPGLVYDVVDKLNGNKNFSGVTVCMLILEEGKPARTVTTFNDVNFESATANCIVTYLNETQTPAVPVLDEIEATVLLQTNQ